MKLFTFSAVGAAIFAASCAPSTPTLPAPTGAFYDGVSAAATDRATTTLQIALETTLSGQQSKWQMPSGASGTIAPTETFKSKSGHWCRRFTETISSGETLRNRSDVACRVDGRWRLVKGT